MLLLQAACKGGVCIGLEQLLNYILKKNVHMRPEKVRHKGAILKSSHET
jgi:hypothetical protein